MKLLGRIKWLNSVVRFGCDTKGQIAECERAMSMMNAEGYNGYCFLYTMLSDSIDESYERINYWKEQLKLSRAHRGGYKVYAYAQPFRDPVRVNKIEQWQKDMA